VSDAQQHFINSLQKKNTGQHWAISLIQKALDVMWDTWTQRNDINNNSLHPRHTAEVFKIKVQLQLLFRQGYEGFLRQDCLLFSKPKHILLQGPSKCYNVSHLS
jgi:hypothetical protein